MKSLQTVQKTFRVFQILTQIAMILCFVWAGLAALGMLCGAVWYHGGVVVGASQELLYRLTETGGLAEMTGVPDRNHLCPDRRHPACLCLPLSESGAGRRHALYQRGRPADQEPGHPHHRASHGGDYCGSGGERHLPPAPEYRRRLEHQRGHGHRPDPHRSGLPLRGGTGRNPRFAGGGRNRRKVKKGPNVRRIL